MKGQIRRSKTSPTRFQAWASDPKYLHTQVSAGIDWRQSPGYTRRGGLYEVTFHDYKSDQDGAYSFQKLDGDLIQHFPIFARNWILVATRPRGNHAE